MSATKPIRRPAALHYLTGEIERLHIQREALRQRMVQDAADIDGIDELLAELEQLRSEA